MSVRSYEDAINSLNTLQSNAAVLAAARAAGPVLNPNAIKEMDEFVTRIGITPEDLNALNVIHITGTKGKGSTSAFTDSILRHASPGMQVGLYTSPHLVAVRERIRVGGHPLSEEEFTKYFFEVWDKLEANPPITPGFPPMPNYFRYLTLVAFHAFKSLRVDAAILEVGIGGTGDSTNVVPKPVVTGITPLGMDHVAILGGSIEAIARQKGGIYKKDVPALSVEQPNQRTALESILREIASTVKASEFRVVKELPDLKNAKLGLAGKHQLLNASLAVELARVFLLRKGGPLSTQPLPDIFLAGLENTKWPGRCQTVCDRNYPSTTWYLDGAHTTESLTCCVEWFVSPGVGLPESQATRPLRVLVFNCTSGRSGEEFLGTIFNKTKTLLSVFSSPEAASTFFDQVIFCSNVTYTDGHFKGDLTSVAIATAEHTGPTIQDLLKTAWLRLVEGFPPEAVHSLPSIEHAIRKVREFSSARNVSVLVTGSLHLVGGIIEVAGLSSDALGDL
ncbi:hypothetical protein PAXRUDRAFT_821486 [Paxillus rubicundulus Ve08.2h10]|uniref:Folylpolyglutamate synthase n=1 Tax=Paxillus rubicundulus Ve08.2h10 TaxID=930991 RepID=A0A0D0E6G6_9AGAM|nr:hypothetical protein PAXRUDRAFT_821486 [Paxillus rubicundulus Ve08.2h10]